MVNSRSCFVIMPFRPELNYFYLYVQQYLSDEHGIHCERGDHKILTKPLLEKIRSQILEADVIIADITGRNPNVLYELGLADAYGKRVILITQDSSEDVPTDIKHLEFIKYELSNHVDFLDKLDNAIHNVFVERYQDLYKKARNVLDSFNKDTGLNYQSVNEKEFQRRIVQAERTQGIPTDVDDLSEFLLPRIIKESTDRKVMRSVTEWLDSKVVEEEK